MATKTRKQQIEEMLEEEPDDTFLRYGLGMEYVGEGNQEAAVHCFRELLRLDATYVPAYLQAGQALVRLGRLNEARDLWREGVAAARQKGDQHAADEMQGMLANLEGA